MNKSKKLSLIILFFLTACASETAKPRPECSAYSNVAFGTSIESTPVTIVYQNSDCEDLTSLYGAENEKVFFLNIRDSNVYQPSVESKNERYVISKDNAMVTYKKISGKPVIIFQSSMFGTIYAFSPKDGAPEIGNIPYRQGYIPKNGEIIAQITENKIIFKVTQDIPDIGNYDLYTLMQGSQIEINFHK